MVRVQQLDEAGEWFFRACARGFYPSRVGVGGEWILEGEKGAYNRRHGEAAPHSYVLLKVTHSVLGNGELRPGGTSHILALPQ